MKDNTQFKETHFGILTFAIAKKNIFKLRLYQLLLEQESKSNIRSTLFFTFTVKPNIEYIYHCSQNYSILQAFFQGRCVPLITTNKIGILT